ncbi:hypothetical protein ACUNFK_24190 [Serratia sp. IR-2025]
MKVGEMFIYFDAVRKTLTFVIGLLCCQSAVALQWPVLDSPRITECSTGKRGPCSSNVYYTSNGTIFVDVMPVGSPSSRIYSVEPYGLKCTQGNSLTGTPFTYCSWNPRFGGVVHVPLMRGECVLKSPGSGSWELRDDSTCAVDLDWGPKSSGAGPGADCVVFGWAHGGTVSVIETPWGQLSALTVANGGSHFCPKLLPPDVRCDIRVPQEIDHGTLGLNQVSQRTLFGYVDCGSSPKVEVLGGAELVLGQGGRSTLEIIMESESQLRFNSKVEVFSDADTGEHQAAYVVIASPY